jgi:hypothetical protein
MQVSGKKTVLLFAIVGVVTIAVVLLSFRRIGWDRFRANTKLMEGKSNVVGVARGAMACVERTGALPETSPAVPATLADVGGKPYRSRADDWDHPSWRCMRWSVKGEQFFRYQWVKNADGSSGIARTEADFDGNGNPEAVYEQVVMCNGTGDGFHCWPGDFRDIAQLR